MRMTRAISQPGGRACSAASDSDRAVAVRPPAPIWPMARRSKPLALVVEHDAWLRSMVADLLEEAGFAVVVVSNGFSGVRAAQRFFPRLVVLGEALPELTCAEVTAELQVRRTARPYIVLTRALLNATQSALPEKDEATHHCRWTRRVARRTLHQAAHVDRSHAKTGLGKVTGRARVRQDRRPSCPSATTTRPPIESSSRSAAAPVP